MNEEQAKTKWCPMIRATPSFVFEDEKCVEVFGTHSGTHVNCIGSACMMWRHDRSRTVRAHKKIIVEHGYCGLAGKP
jgi:hypothetical protein